MKPLGTEEPFEGGAPGNRCFYLEGQTAFLRAGTQKSGPLVRQIIMMLRAIFAIGFLY